jgi:hypothetical protein
VLDWIIVCGNLGWPPNKRRILAKAYAAAVSDRPVIPATAYSMAGSGKKPADVAADAESKSVAESKARLLQLPADLQEVFSLPRYVAPASARSGDAHGTSRALLAARCSLLVTEAGMIARLKALSDAKEGKERAKEERKAAKAAKAASGKGKAAPKRAAKKAAVVAAAEAPAAGAGAGACAAAAAPAPLAAKAAGEAEALRRWQGREGRFLL